MTLPPNFKWIETIGVLPKMIQEGIKVLGIKEIAGPANNPEIMRFALELGVADIYTSDDKQAWCALSHCGIAKRAGKIVTFTDRYDYLRALSFAKQYKIHPEQWELIDRDNAMFGDSMAFSREGGGHIFINVGESSTHYYGMGGNQANMYSFTRVSKDRLHSVLRPKYNVKPESVKKYILSDTGTPISTNEV